MNTSCPVMKLDNKADRHNPTRRDVDLAWRHRRMELLHHRLLLGQRHEEMQIFTILNVARNYIYRQRGWPLI
jgi:hypothetical protein